MADELTFEQVEAASRLEDLRSAARERGKQIAKDAAVKAVKGWASKTRLWTAIVAAAQPILITLAIVIGFAIVVAIINEVVDFFVGGTAACESDPMQCNVASPGMQMDRPMDKR